jgi:hypothetical protein
MSEMNQILTSLKDRYKQMENLMASTKEMEKVIFVNDLESLGIVLNMRQEAMDKIDDINTVIQKTVLSLETSYRDRVKEILNNRSETMQLDNPLETNIFDTNRITRQLLKRIIDLDQVVNERMHKKTGNGTTDTIL